MSDLLDLHGIADDALQHRTRSRVVRDDAGDAPQLIIGAVAHPLGPGGSYIPDTVIEEVPQNLADLEWILKDIALRENILLIGEAGVGKNKLESYLAHLLNYNLLVIGMSGETRVSDLLTYRSFGEEEAGRTGDTATLGLRALTDPEHGWIIVLDEANKAHPGVLVSYNDLLQDRVVRLPGGKEAPVTACICVNINPNRPPYEVNDFSFEFMDRFSIHTITHLPADQAVDVLKKKYPDADCDFVTDIVQGYYTLHPLYSSGILFEPVTMRNEEAAIERGLQYPDRASNLIDLLCTCYGPRDGRELQAIQGALGAAGFDRNVLAAAHVLEQVRASWEQEGGSEERAIALAETYRSMDKPSAAIGILRGMISRTPLRDWVYHQAIAKILIGSGTADEAEQEYRKGFPTGRVLAIDNGDEYCVLQGDVRISQGIPCISVEAQNVRTGNAALITTLPESPAHSLHRFSGEYSLTFSDREHGLAVYERTQGTDTGAASPGSLCSLVRECIQVVGYGPGFAATLCRLPSPPWAGVRYSDGDVIREIPGTSGGFRLAAHTGGGWSVTYPGGAPRTIGWSPEHGEFFCTRQDGEIFRASTSEDPFQGLTYHAPSGTVYLILPDDLAEVAGREGTGDRGPGTQLCVLSPGAYHSRVIAPLIGTVLPRLENIYRYSRQLSRLPSPGSGDIIFSLHPGLGIRTAVAVEIDGFGPAFRDISPGMEAAPGRETLIERMVIPFSLLDTCEEWHARAFSPEVQHQLQDIRRYAAAAFLNHPQPRDMVFEARACAILADYRESAEPVTGGTLLRRGDILVRNSDGSRVSDLPGSVFIVRFLHESSGGGPKGNPPVIRGFLLGEPNPVVTMEISSIPGQFSLMHVAGDDRYDRMVRNLVIAYHESGRPLQYARTGFPHDPEVRMECNGFSLKYRPMERRFIFSVDLGDADTEFTIEETGYPAENTVLHTGTREVTRWQGLPIIDIRYYRDQDAVLIVLADDFLSLMRSGRVIGEEPCTGPGGVEFRFIGGSGAGDMIGQDPG